jgi:hypothetical protein
MSMRLTAHTPKVAPPADQSIDPRCGLMPSIDEPVAVRDAGSYSLRAAKRAAFAAYALALDSGQTQRESFAAALSGWRKFRPDDGNVEVHENVVPVVLAVLDLDESDRGLLPA